VYDNLENKNVPVNC